MASSEGHDSGDWENHIEVKVSVVNSNNKINLVQIRPWQPLEYYVLIIIEKEPTISVTVLNVPAEEIYALPLEVAHGSKIIAGANTHNEQRITTSWNSREINEFKRKYTYEKF